MLFLFFHVFALCSSIGEKSTKSSHPPTAHKMLSRIRSSTASRRCMSTFSDDVGKVNTNMGFLQTGWKREKYSRANLRGNAPSFIRARTLSSSRVCPLVRTAGVAPVILQLPSRSSVCLSDGPTICPIDSQADWQSVQPYSGAKKRLH